jgi:hypothetical protein
LIAFWLPVPPGIVAFLQLRKTVARWERARERGQLAAPLPAGAAANPAPDSILHKVK